MSELEGLARKAAEENELLRKKMKEEGLTSEGEPGSTVDPEKLQRLSRAMREGKGDLKRRLEKLRKEGLLDSEDLKRCDCDGDIDADALADFLEKECGKCSLQEMLARCQGAGRGGTTRGPGHAELTFGKESSAEGAKFKEQVLPPPALAKLKDNRLIGVSPGDPEKGRSSPAESGALAGAQAGGGSAVAPVVLPRHRPAVQRYFDRPATK